MRDTRGWNVDRGSRMCSSKAAGALFYIFPSVSSANIASGCFLPARNKRPWVACTLFWSRLRSHQLTQRQKGWQPVRIPGASLLHPVSVCWTKRWHEALADSAHQFSTHFFHLGRKQISWPWFHSRECLPSATGECHCSDYHLFTRCALWPDCIFAIRQRLTVMLKASTALCARRSSPPTYER